MLETHCSNGHNCIKSNTAFGNRDEPLLVLNKINKFCIASQGFTSNISYKSFHNIACRRNYKQYAKSSKLFSLNTKIVFNVTKNDILYIQFRNNKNITSTNTKNLYKIRLNSLAK